MKPAIFWSFGILLLGVVGAVWVATRPSPVALDFTTLVRVDDSETKISIVGRTTAPFHANTAVPLYCRTYNHSLPLIGDILTVKDEIRSSTRYVKVDSLDNLEHSQYFVEIRSGPFRTISELFPLKDYYVTGEVLFWTGSPIPLVEGITFVECYPDGGKSVEFLIYSCPMELTAEQGVAG